MSQIELAEPAILERACRGLAVLDAILCEEWDLRLYSFNAGWDVKTGERMASMRNGCGDEWFLVFSGAGAFLKAYWHEYAREDAGAIYEGLPTALAALREEPSFSMDDVTFGGFHDGEDWVLRGNSAPMEFDLVLLDGDAEAYQAYAASYFEVDDLPLEAIRHVLSGEPLDERTVVALRSERTLSDLAADLAEAGYPCVANGVSGRL